MITKRRDLEVPCKRCEQMHRPDDPMCPHCGYPAPDTRRPADAATAGTAAPADGKTALD